jgi:excisionase family DNA binding protein
MKQFLTISEAAKLLKVNRSTVLRWLHKGLLEATRLPGTRTWRIPLSSYEAFIKQHFYEGREF